MDPKDRDERLEIEALERLLAAKADGRTDDLSTFGDGDPARTAAAQRARDAVTSGSKHPDGTTAESPPPADDPLRVGAYRLLRPIGRGGQGEVWLADDTRLKRQVALKILHRGFASADDALLRFRREAETASRVDHPGVCTVFEVGRDRGRAWMAMRYVEGAPLSARLADSGLPRATRADLHGHARFIEEVARAVHVVHEAGVIHRDLKPSNIIVGRDGHPVVLDFGLARDEVSDGATLTASGAVFGTPPYMAPEQILGQPGIDRRVDVYALGVILYQLVTGRLPREGPTFEALRASAMSSPTSARRLNPATSRSLDVVIATALAPDLRLRYRTALDLADDLRRVCEFEPVHAKPAGPLVRLFSWARREPGMAAASSALIVVLAAGLCSFAYMNARQAQTIEERDQVADIRHVRDLLDREVRLWPVGPALVEPCDQWLREADAKLARQTLHESARSRLRDGAIPDGPESRHYALETDAYFDDVLSELLAGLGRLRDRRAMVAERRQRASTLQERTLRHDAASDWARCIQAIRTSPKYHGLEVRPQLGLIPLGLNESTGLYEFWHVESGARPPFDPQRGGVAALGAGIVLVLLPGGNFELGASEDDQWADMAFEAPGGEVTLDPYFISKYELTQDQWARLDEGRNPSYYPPGTLHGSGTDEGRSVTLLHPVEFIAWTEAKTRITHAGMALPTEAQWEMACRGGTSTPWSCGRQPADTEGFANIAGVEMGPSYWTVIRPAPFDDHRHLHAPVGSFRPNPIGLFDCHGNVAEWCEDDLVRSYAAAAPRRGDGLRTPAVSERLRIVRGGSMHSDVVDSRSSCRNFQMETDTARDVGVRPARPLE